MESRSNTASFTTTNFNPDTLVSLFNLVNVHLHKFIQHIQQKSINITIVYGLICIIEYWLGVRTIERPRRLCG